MTELTVDDVAQYTRGVLAASDPETARLLSAALATIRRYCGWNVTRTTETMTVDGSGQLELILPTLYINSITSITTTDLNGVTADVDLSKVQYSNQEPGVLHLTNWTFWPYGWGNIQVSLDHGYEQPDDWNAAVLELCDRMGAQVGTVIGNSGPMTSKRVDDVTYEWGRSPSSPGQSPGASLRMFDGLNHTLLDRYRILPFA